MQPLSPEVTGWINLFLNLVGIGVLCALAVWLRQAHVSNIQLRAQLLGMIVALHLTINGKTKDLDDTHGLKDSAPQ